MKQRVKHHLIVTLAFAFLFVLSGCSNLINGQEAKTHVESFFDVVAEGDFQAAKTYLHPSQTEDIESFFAVVEEAKGVDFQSGIVIQKYTGGACVMYDSTVGGGIYELRMIITVSEKNLSLTISLIKNNDGFGIHNINFNAE